MYQMSIQTIADDLRDEFAFLDDWETRDAHIIDLGRQLPDLDASERSEENKVRGCASQVWIVADQPASPADPITFRAQSDAMIVSGLISILMRLYSHQRADNILAFDAEAFFEEIGIKDALSAQRANGLTSMLARIRAIAETVLASAPQSS